MGGLANDLEEKLEMSQISNKCEWKGLKMAIESFICSNIGRICPHENLQSKIVLRTHPDLIFCNWKIEICMCPDLKSGRIQIWNLANEKSKSGLVCNWNTDIVMEKFCQSGFFFLQLKNWNPDVSGSFVFQLKN